MWNIQEVEDQIYALFETRTMSRFNNYSPQWETRLPICNLKSELGLHGQLSWEESPWTCTLLKIYRKFTAKVYVFSDSVLCLGGQCPQYPESARVSEQKKISTFVSTSEYRELENLTGGPFVFEWKAFPGHTTKQLLQKIQNMMEIEL